MKYVKYHYKKISAVVLLCASLGFLGGCGSSKVKSNNINEQATLSLASTLEFIPVQEKDKEGNFKPYLVNPSPYENKKGRIDKESVLQFIEGKRSYIAGNYDKAKNIFESMVSQDSKLSGPWVYLGDIALNGDKEDLSLAKQHYTQALSVNPDNINAYLRLALVQRKLGEYLLAQNTYADVLKVWKDFPEAHLNLAILYDIYLNHPIRAQRHFEAYLFLTGSQDKEQHPKVAEWLKDLKNRTGMATQLKVVPALAEG